MVGEQQIATWKSVFILSDRQSKKHSHSQLLFSVCERVADERHHTAAYEAGRCDWRRGSDDRSLWLAKVICCCGTREEPIKTNVMHRQCDTYGTHTIIKCFRVKKLKQHVSISVSTEHTSATFISAKPREKGFHH